MRELRENEVLVERKSDNQQMIMRRDIFEKSGDGFELISPKPKRAGKPKPKALADKPDQVPEKPQPLAKKRGRGPAKNKMDKRALADK